MAQQYLLDCVIQVFSDECHLSTLGTLLDACMRVLPSVDLKPVLVNLMNRLSSFVQTDSDNISAGVDIFSLFREHLDELFARPVSGEAPTGGPAAMELSSLLELQVAFLSFTLSLYPTRVDYIDIILGATVILLSRVLTPHRVVEGSGVVSVVELLARPLRSLSLSVLKMEHFTHLMLFLDLPTRKQVSVSMVEAVIEAKTPLDDPEAVSRFLSFISPLVRDDPDSAAEASDSESPEFAYEQQQVAKLVHAIQHDDSDEVFNMYATARTCFADGGERRLVHVLPPLVICALKLIPRIRDREQVAAQEELTPPSVNIKKVFQFVHKGCGDLVSCDAEVALRLFLQCAVVADKADQTSPGTFEPICYEFVTQALVAYEEELSDSRSQFSALTMIVGTMVGYIHCLEQDNYDNLSAKVTQHGAKLLKKPDQCRAVLLCSHLFWNNPSHRDSRRVLECLKKCLKIADVAVQSSTTHVSLFAEILDKYVYYFQQDNQEVTLEFIQNLVSLCAEHMRYADSDVCEEARRNFCNTLTYIRGKIEKDADSKFQGLRLDDVVFDAS
eukprot:GHVS01050021.1.p1 GENE.GHVS01050021.1~~GHVS01050021.1.p1  ORF type:complete len:588 (-),score=73.25 GHVS01050021.1:224-1894(-)